MLDSQNNTTLVPENAVLFQAKRINSGIMCAYRSHIIN